MTYILCLAHYCDIHGPTPLMVTEGLRASCSICFEEPGPKTIPDDKHRPHLTTTASPSAQNPAVITDALRNLSISRSVSVPASEPDAQAQRTALLRSTATGSGPLVPASALETPPDSPRAAFQQPRRDSSFRRTYDDTVTKKQGPCDNCAMTLPPKQAAALAAQDPAAALRGPTLRTRAPAERIFGPGGQTSPPNSQSSSDSDGDREVPAQRVGRRDKASTAASSRTTSCSSASTASDRRPSHVHYVDYTSTHEPVLANSFSLIRASCLRTLSFETLPRAPSTAMPTSPSIQNPAPSFVTTQSAGSAASGGPIFFGDALAGYTTAYIFRIPDVHARGHKRVYAFIALSTHKERLAMKTFAVISAAFRDMATWIQHLAEAEAERSADSSPLGSMMYSGPPTTHQPPPPSAFDTPVAVDRGQSSFLTGGSGFTRRMGGGGGGSALKSRGLAELVGQPDFFIELHKKFVQLLFEVGVTLGS